MGEPCAVSLARQRSFLARCDSRSFGCERNGSTSTVWVSGGCRGDFLCDGVLVSCGFVTRTSPEQRCGCSAPPFPRRAEVAPMRIEPPAPRAMICDLLILASLSERTNLSNVAHIVNQFNSSWKCLILGHSLPENAKIPSRCDLAVLHGTQWGEIINNSSRIIDNYGCNNHMLMLDDVQLDSKYFRVDALVNHAVEQELDIASPVVNAATYPWMRSCRHTFRFIEIYATLFTKSAWKYFQKLLEFLPGIGWGYDICLGEHFRSGLDCSQTVKHMGHRSPEAIQRGKWEYKRITNACCAADVSAIAPGQARSSRHGRNMSALRACNLRRWFGGG